METELLYNGKLKLINLTCTETGYWQFNFNNTVNLGTFCFWRFKRNGELIYISLDHNERFGRKFPLNLVEEVGGVLKNNNLLKIKRNIKTGDVFFIFEDAIVIEFFTSSMGYEN